VPSRSAANTTLSSFLHVEQTPRSKKYRWRLCPSCRAARIVSDAAFPVSAKFRTGLLLTYTYPGTRIRSYRAPLGRAVATRRSSRPNTFSAVDRVTEAAGGDPTRGSHRPGRRTTRGHATGAGAGIRTGFGRMLAHRNLPHVTPEVVVLTRGGRVSVPT